MHISDKILLAIYDKHRLGTVDLRQSVQPEQLQIEPVEFNQAIQALQVAGLISGAVLVKDRSNDLLQQVILNQVTLTHYGKYYLHNQLLT